MIWNIELACDSCGIIAHSAEKAPTARSPIAFRRALAPLGWTTSKDRDYTGDYCPSCSRSKARREAADE